MAEDGNLGRWLRACAEVGRLLDDAEPDGNGFDSIAREALGAADAALALILVPVGESHHRVAGAAGGTGTMLRGEVFATPLAIRSGASGSAEPGLPVGIGSGREIADAIEAGGESVLPSIPGLVGWLREARLLVAHLGQDAGRDRLLMLARADGAQDFTAMDQQLAGLLAVQVEQAIDRAHIRHLHEQLAVFAERDRIARDLHDIVIQRLFAAGLGVRALTRHIADPAGRARVDEITGELDATIGELRDTIYALRRSVGESEQVSTSILRAVRSACESLPFTPRLRLAGPLDDIRDGPTVSNLLAVVTEALSNAVRHAHASRISISVTVADDELRLRVKDNGHGFSHPVLHSGLRNMDQRAAELGGTCRVASNRRGTRVEWTVPAR